VKPDRESASQGEAEGRFPAQKRSRSRFWLRLWLVAAVLWAGAMVYACLQSWPVFPLDLPRTDPQVQAAYNRAVAAHVAHYTLLALVPPLLVLGFGWLAFRLRPRA
jgi:hypothetical protein